MSALKLAVRFRITKSFLENGLLSCIVHDFTSYRPPLKSMIEKGQRRFSICKPLLDDNLDDKNDKKITGKTFVRADGKIVKKIMPSGPKIALLKDNQQITMYLSEAEKIAKRNGLKLVEVGSAHDKLLYKFEKASSAIKTDAKGKHKKLVLNTESAKHDIQYKLKNAIKHLEKGHQITVSIQKSAKSGPEKMEELFGLIEKSLPPQHKIKGKVVKTDMINFIISPGDGNQNENGKKTPTMRVTEENCVDNENVDMEESISSGKLIK